MTTFPTLEQMLDGLIRIPSISCVNPGLDMSNREIIELLANWLDTGGFHVSLIENESTSTPAPEKLNLVAVHWPAHHSEFSINFDDVLHTALVFAGHTDTVPYDDQRWTTDPFRLSKRDDRWYGLGTADMKSFFALVIDVLRQFDLDKLKQPLVIIATADEETSMDGARAVSRKLKLKDSQVVIGEPTGMTPVFSHKGMMSEAVIIKGQSGHSSNPAHGHSALEAMNRLITALLQWREQWQQQHRDPLFAVPFPTLNLGCIHGGDNPNRICGECELQFDIRPLPGMALDDVRHEIRNLLTGTMNDTDIQLEFRTLFDGVSPFQGNPESGLVKLAVRETGHTATSAAFGTEAPFWQQIGGESLVLGPGHIAQAHQPDEYLELANVEKMQALISQLIRHYCY